MDAKTETQKEQWERAEQYQRDVDRRTLEQSIEVQGEAKIIASFYKELTRGMPPEFAQHALYIWMNKRYTPDSTE